MASLMAKFMGPSWAYLGPTGPRWAPCWPHEPCSLGCFLAKHPFIWQTLCVEWCWVLSEKILTDNGLPDGKVYGAIMGPTGPRWAPCWPHEPCSLGCFLAKHPCLWQTSPHTLLPFLSWMCLISTTTPFTDFNYKTFCYINKSEVTDTQWPKDGYEILFMEYTQPPWYHACPPV